ncbi:MAG: putative 2OG-Fe(II) oxygenase [Acidimicrobiales bacterium]
MTDGTGLHGLWPTPFGVHRLVGAPSFNRGLIRALDAERTAQLERRGAKPGAFFASDDDLLQRLEGFRDWQSFVRFVVTSLLATVREANREAWAGQEFELAVGIEGMWFQCSRDGTFHDVHSHGNCSWSAVYMVQVDEPEKRVLHPVYGATNGVTRFYGPPFTHLAGAFVDIANAYLQPPHLDVEPVPGQLLLFPAWLAHQALPYGGELERVIISFNASVHAAEGDQIHGYSQT